MACANPSDLCIVAAQDAAQINAVPASVLIAITLTETGRTEDGKTRPWPWTVNTEGQGHWFPDRAAALDFAQAEYDRGIRSFDLGCFQINHRWHGENFVSIDQMLDPMANASYAAGYLAQLRNETGDWSSAAGAYHSRTVEYATRYRARFDDFHAAAIATGADDGTMASAAMLASADDGSIGQSLPATRQNSFLLLQPSTAPRALGSLVPLLAGG